MNIQRIAALSKKELKKTIREPAALFMIFLFPIVFVLAFGVSFGGVDGMQTVTYQVGVVNLDGADSQGSQAFTGTLSNMTMLNVNYYQDNQTMQTDLSQGKIQAAIIIPETFSQSINTYYTSPTDASQWVNSTVGLYLDQGSMVATQAIPPIIQQVLTGIFSQNQQATQNPIALQTSSLEVNQMSTFDYFAPGMFTFAYILGAMLIGYMGGALNKRSDDFKRLLISSILAATIGGIVMFGIFQLSTANVVTGIDGFLLTVLTRTLTGAVIAVLAKVFFWYGMGVQKHPNMP